MTTRLPDWLTVADYDRINNHTKAFSKLADAYNALGLGFVKSNRKTGASLDCDAVCQYSCNYCYVANAPPFLKAGRQTGGIFYRPEDEWCDQHREQFTRFLEGHRALARGHFLRLFAHSDYKPAYRAFWREVLDMCRGVGVPTVVFTKTIEAVNDLAPLATRLMISRDNDARWGFDSPKWIRDDTLIAKMMARHPSVRRVAMVVDEQDVAEVKADFYIAYHGKRSHLDIPKPISQTDLLELVGRKHGCSPSHRCYGCPTRCTIGDQAPADKLIQLTVGAAT